MGTHKALGAVVYRAVFLRRGGTIISGDSRRRTVKKRVLEVGQHACGARGEPSGKPRDRDLRTLCPSVLDLVGRCVRRRRLCKLLNAVVL